MNIESLNDAETVVNTPMGSPWLGSISTVDNSANSNNSSNQQPMTPLQSKTQITVKLEPEDENTIYPPFHIYFNENKYIAHMQT